MQEAAEIVSERGTTRVKATEGSEVLYDEVDVQYRFTLVQLQLIRIFHEVLLTSPSVLFF